MTKDNTVKESTPEYLTEAQNLPATLTPDAMYHEMDSDLEKVTENLSLFAELTEKQKAVLVIMARNIVRSDKLTQLEMAEKAGISERHLYDMRQMPKFGAALRELCVQMVRGSEDIVLTELFNRLPKDWRVGEFLLKYTGSYVPRHQSMNINANVSAVTQNLSPTQTMEQIVIQWGGLGLTKERFCEIYDELKGQGAF
jgi:DNA-binding phage protein